MFQHILHNSHIKLYNIYHIINIQVTPYILENYFDKKIGSLYLIIPSEKNQDHFCYQCDVFREPSNTQVKMVRIREKKN